MPRRLHRGRHPDPTGEPNQISRLSPLGGVPCGFVDNAPRYPQPHRAISNRSGHIMCYENRTSLRASNTSALELLRASRNRGIVQIVTPSFEFRSTLWAATYARWKRGEGGAGDASV